MNHKIPSIFTVLLMVTMSCVPNITFAQVQANEGCSAEALTGLIDPSTGRFITRDPLVGPLTLPHSQNPYAYAVSDSYFSVS